MYRGSEHGFTISSSRPLLMNENQILSIVKTSNNRIFGAFTTSAVVKRNKYEKSIEDPDSFMFSVNHMSILKPNLKALPSLAVTLSKKVILWYGAGSRDMCI